MPTLKKPSHEKFAQAVVKGMSIDAAYVRAGFKPHRTNPHRLRNSEPIAARIQELLEKIEERTVVSVERVLKENARIAYANVTDALSFTSRTVKLKSSKDLPDDITAAIAEVQQTKDGVRIKFHDKGRALEALARHKGMYRENIDLHVTVSLLDLVNASYPAPAPKIIEHDPTE